MKFTVFKTASEIWRIVSIPTGRTKEKKTDSAFQLTYLIHPTQVTNKQHLQPGNGGKPVLTALYSLQTLDHQKIFLLPSLHTMLQFLCKGMKICFKSCQMRKRKGKNLNWLFNYCIYTY